MVGGARRLASLIGMSLDVIGIKIQLHPRLAAVPIESLLLYVFARRSAFMTKFARACRHAHWILKFPNFLEARATASKKNHSDKNNNQI